MGEFQIFDTTFKKINPASQIRADDNCVPHTGQNSSDLSSVFPGGGSHWDQPGTAEERTAVLGHWVTPEPTQFHLQLTPTL